MERAGDIDEALGVLDRIYIARGDPERDKQLDAALDRIAAHGEAGTTILLDWLFRNMSVSSTSIHVSFGGDEAHNEWLKKREVIRALVRARAESAVSRLAPLLTAQSPIAQFSQILRPAVVQALEELRGPVAPPKVDTRSSEPRSPEDIVRHFMQTELPSEAPDFSKLAASIEHFARDDKHGVWISVAETLMQNGDKSRAVKCYIEALRHHPERSIAWKWVKGYYDESVETPARDTPEVRAAVEQLRQRVGSVFDDPSKKASWWKFWR